MKIERKPRENGIAAEAMEMAKRTLTVTLVIEADVEDLDQWEMEELPEQVAAALGNATGDYEGVTERTNLSVIRLATAQAWTNESYAGACYANQAE
jgi:hypothetical protein